MFAEIFFMDRNILKIVINDQQEIRFRKEHVSRMRYVKMYNDKEIVVISGVRRCGKSTFLGELRASLPEKHFYLNFDDDRLMRFTVEDFQPLLELFIMNYGDQKICYFDEIQNIEGWERFVNRLYESGYKIYITGSNAKMLSRELGTFLTGRYYRTELYPFSFYEYLDYQKVKVTDEMIYSTKGKAKLYTLFNDYFDNGGFPAYLESKNDQYLKSLYESVIYKDVLVRNKLTNEKEVLELVYFLVTNVAKTFSYNSLAQIIGVSSASTVKNYLDFLQDTYLIFLVPKFDFSLKKQIQNAKKVYFIDNAMVRQLGFRFSDDSGRMLENMVYIELRRQQKEVFYHKNKKECDFLVREGAVITEAYQVTYVFENLSSRQRELDGLYEALQMYNLEVGYILTDDEETELVYKGKKIKVMMVWRWMLGVYNDI